MEKLEIQLKNIDELKEYENNAKRHPTFQIKQIAHSIEKFGFNDPIAVDENGVIIEGHGRLYAAKELGMTEVPIIVLSHMTEQEKKAYILTHNKLTMNTDFEYAILQEELDSIYDFNMEDFGFDTTKIDWATIDDLSDENYEEPTVTKLQCPKCEHIDYAIHFKKIEEKIEE